MIDDGFIYCGAHLTVNICPLKGSAFHSPFSVPLFLEGFICYIVPPLCKSLRFSSLLLCTAINLTPRPPTSYLNISHTQQTGIYRPLHEQNIWWGSIYEEITASPSRPDTKGQMCLLTVTSIISRSSPQTRSSCTWPSWRCSHLAPSSPSQL